MPGTAAIDIHAAFPCSQLLLEGQRLAARYPAGKNPIPEHRRVATVQHQTGCNLVAIHSPICDYRPHLHSKKIISPGSRFSKTNRLS